MNQILKKLLYKKIHPSVKIGKHCVIHRDVIIHKNTVIGDFVTITKKTIIGNNCHIGHYSILDECFLSNYVKIQGRVRIGKHCILEEYVEMKYNSILTSDAHIGKDVFIGVGAVTLGSDVDGEQISGTHIGAKCYIGGHALIAPGLKVPSKTIVGANSFLRYVDMDGGGTYVGNPAKKIR